MKAFARRGRSVNKDRATRLCSVRTETESRPLGGRLRAVSQIVARRFIGTLGLLTLIGAYPLAAVASGITYVDMFEQWNGGIRAGTDEIVRLWVSSGGCRIPQRDSPPVVNGGVIEFTLAFGALCFSTPPGFTWAGNIGPLPAGTYTVNYYAQSFDVVYGPKALIATQTLLVGTRPSAPSLATPGLADPSFGTDGVLRIPASYYVGSVRIEEQTGGRILVGVPALVSRLTEVGAFDGDFAQDGQLLLSDDGRNKTGVASVGANDQILVAEYVFNDPLLITTFGLRRYSSAGEFTAEIVIDPRAFPVLLLTPAYPYPESFGTEVVGLPDGRFVAAVASFDPGTYGPSKWFIVRFTPDGKLDKSFGNGGIYAGPSSPGYIHRLVPTPDGGLLALGTDSKTTPATFLTKLTGAGQIDGSFGQDGFVYGTFARCTPRLQNDGSILVGRTDFSILKLLSNGAPDLSFGTLGVLPNRTGMPLLLQDFLRQDDGKFVLAGSLFVGSDSSSGWPFPVYQPVLTRYMQDGTLDTAFGVHGLAKIDVTTTVGIGTNDTTPIGTMSLLGLPNGAGVLAVNGQRGSTTYIYRFQGDSNPLAFPNYQGLWWNAPPGSEAGWGINLAHQGDLIFSSWFTYDPAGKPWWLVMTAAKTADKTYAGSLYQVTGPAFDATPFPPVGQLGGATGSIVGEATLTFGDENNAVFKYAVNGVTQTKAITRQAFGLLPKCTFGTTTNLALATNYQDLWWAAPAGSEAGWGINLAHQGDTIFATWFTYDHDHSPMWLVVTAARTASASYTGALYRAMSGPPFNAVPFPALGNAGGAIGGIVGSATFTFGDGNHGTFAYTVDGAAQTKAITREIFASPGTVCR